MYKVCGDFCAIAGRKDQAACGAERSASRGVYRVKDFGRMNIKKAVARKCSSPLLSHALSANAPSYTYSTSFTTSRFTVVIAPFSVKHDTSRFGA